MLFVPSLRSAMMAVGSSLPITIGSTLILYGSVAPDRLSQGVFAACLGLVLIHLLTAGSKRPVIYAARFFEAATLAVMVHQVAAQLPEWGVAATTGARMATLGLIAAGAGIVVGVLWSARADRFARFIPWPVFAGFGCTIALAIFLKQPLALWQQIQALQSTWPVLGLWAIVFGACVALQRSRPDWPAGFLGLALGAILGLGLWGLGYRLPTLMDGWTLSPPIGWSDVALLWQGTANTPRILLAIAQNAAILGVLVFLNTVVVGTQLGHLDDRRDLSRQDHALQALGLFGAGLVGAAPMSGAPTASLAAGGRDRLDWRTMVAVAALVAAVYASQALLWLPLVVVLAVLAFDGWVLWDRPSGRSAWQWLRRQALPPHQREDLLLVTAVVLASLLANMVVGLVVGLLLGLLLHAYRNTRTPVRQVLTGDQTGSHCIRNKAEQAILGRYPKAIKVLELDANQFFASAEQLYTTVKSELTPDVRVMILDWTAVRHIDSSLAKVVEKLDKAAAHDRVLMLHAGTQLQDGSVHTLLTPFVEAIRLPSDLDHALEDAENLIIQGDRLYEASAFYVVPQASSLLRQLSAADQRLVLERMSEHRFSAGGAIITRGDPSDGLWLIREGTAHVCLTDPHGRRVRLAVFREGTMVGEIGFLDGAPRSATVEAATDVTALHLARSAFDDLAARRPDIAQHLIANMAIEMAGRFRLTTQRAANRMLSR